MPESESTSFCQESAADGRFLRLGTRGWLAALLGFAFFYFYSGGGPNQASRFDLDRALLEHGQVFIDEYQGNTIDKAFYKGHHYSEKAPGSSLTALPVLALARVGLRFVGIDPVSQPGLLAQMHAAAAWVATLPALFMCLVLFDWSIRRGFSRKGAAFAALALGLTSPLWAYSSLFWGHVLAAFCLLYGAKGVMTLARRPPPAGATRTALLAGLATGWAVVTEFPSTPAAFVFTVILVWKLRPWSRAARQPFAAYVVGATATALVLGAYNLAAFGSPFHLGYASVQGFDGMKEGIFGVTRPRAEALYGLLISPRGLLCVAPVLVFGLVGHALSIARASHSRVAVLSLVVIVYSIMLNASYRYWNGGWTYGPRHVTIALPFLALGLAPFYDAIGRLRPLALALLVGGIFLTLVAVSTHGMTPEDFRNPFKQYLWPAFREGRVALSDGYHDAGGPATNFGLALGLPSKLSLFPFLAGFIVGTTGLLISLRKPRPAQTSNNPTPTGE